MMLRLAPHAYPLRSRAIICALKSDRFADRAAPVRSAPVWAAVTVTVTRNVWLRALPSGPVVSSRGVQPFTAPDAHLFGSPGDLRVLSQEPLVVFEIKVVLVGHAGGQRNGPGRLRGNNSMR